MCLHTKWRPPHAIGEELGATEGHANLQGLVSWLAEVALRTTVQRYSAEDFEPQLEVILRAFTKLGVIYDHRKLDNFLVVKGKVMVVDLESVCGEARQDLEYSLLDVRKHIRLSRKMTNSSLETRLSSPKLQLRNYLSTTTAIISFNRSKSTAFRNISGCLWIVGSKAWPVW